MTSKKGRKKTWAWIGGVLVLIVAITGGYQYSTKKTHIIKYEPAKVTRSDIRTTILSTGVVAPENRIDLKAPVAGRIEKVLVEEGQKVRRGQVLALMSSTERAALIDTAQTKGKEEVKYWENSYNMTPILAPSAGLIILKSADSGQTVTQTDSILSMSDRLMVKANVDETDLADVKVGQKAKMILDAFPNEPLESEVYHIGYDAKTVNNVTTYEVDVRALETPDFMKSGMTANVTFLIEERQQVLTVPAASIKREKKKSFVLVPAENPKDEPVSKEVQVGISDGKRVEIVSGLSEGDTILTAGVRSLTRKEEPQGSPFSPMGNRPKR